LDPDSVGLVHADPDLIQIHSTAARTILEDNLPAIFILEIHFLAQFDGYISHLAHFNGLPSSEFRRNGEDSLQNNQSTSLF
jgi:hypothetical protein